MQRRGPERHAHEPGREERPQLRPVHRPAQGRKRITWLTMLPIRMSGTRIAAGPSGSMSADRGRPNANPAVPETTEARKHAGIRR